MFTTMTIYVKGDQTLRLSHTQEILTVRRLVHMVIRLLLNKVTSSEVLINWLFSSI